MNSQTTIPEWYDDRYRIKNTRTSPWNYFLIEELKRLVRPHQRLVERITRQ